MRVSVGRLRQILLEARYGRRALLTEDGDGDSQAHVEGASGTSLDTQVDKYLAQYEGDAKKSDVTDIGGPSTSQMERLDWSDLVRGVLTEAGDDDDAPKDDADDKPADDAPGDTGFGGPPKLGIDHLDVDKFADSIVRLIDNYDSLLEVRNTLVRRAKAFLAKTYDDEVQKAFDDVMKDDHGIEPGTNTGDLNADKYPAPSADRASGSAEPGAGGAGG